MCNKDVKVYMHAVYIKKYIIIASGGESKDKTRVRVDLH